MEPFKNLINEAAATRIANSIQLYDKKFNHKNFLLNISRELEPLELKQRVIFLADRLNQNLSDNLLNNLKILVKTLKKNENDKIGLSGFEIWPITDFVSRYGLSEFESSLLALKEMTKVFTSEFAVRNFFIEDEKETLKFFKKIVSDDNHHVRRWVSEGSRPLLPWGQKLNSFVKDPEITFDLLEKLKFDSSEYVIKSVANHMNDHSKNHPEWVTKRLLAWKKEAWVNHKTTVAATNSNLKFKYGDNNLNKNMNWLVKHASRTLIKKGYQSAFELHDIKKIDIVILEKKIINKKLKLGDKLKLKLIIINNENKTANLIIDNEIHLLRSNDKYNIKCFKGKKVVLKPKQKALINMEVPFKKVTTRKYYSGRHFWNPKVNGISYEKVLFMLKCE